MNEPVTNTYTLENVNMKDGTIMPLSSYFEACDCGAADINGGLAEGELEKIEASKNSSYQPDSFLESAAKYFEKRPTNGEDIVHWSNIYNALNCRKAAEKIAVLTDERDMLSEAVHNEIVNEKSGFWNSCTGCHEYNHGVPQGPYNKIFQCHQGLGCSECGGIGVVWDNIDYSAVAKKETEQ